MIPGRSHNNDLIEKAFIDKILKEEADSLEKAQTRILSGSKDHRIDMIRYSRTFSVSNNTLTHTHNIQQRFIDMKRTRLGRQKPIKVHNTPLYNHLNNIIYRLSTNLTEAVRAQITDQLNIELYG